MKKHLTLFISFFCVGVLFAAKQGGGLDQSKKQEKQKANVDKKKEELTESAPQPLSNEAREAARQALTQSYKNADFSKSDQSLMVNGKYEIVKTPTGQNALCFSDKFTLRIDLKTLGVNPLDFDLVKFDLKTDPKAVMRMTLENYPKDGPQCHWYFLDAGRGAIEWRTQTIDLKVPEELKQKDIRAWRDNSVDGRYSIFLTGDFHDLTRSGVKPGEKIWVSNIRFVKKSIDLDWDISKAPYQWGEGKDLVYTYPLTVKNLTQQKLTAKLDLISVDARQAVAAVEPKSLPLEPGEIKTVQATISLPAAFAAQQKPLYCERFEAVAEAEEVPDSRVTILRSADPIHLSVVVPIPENQMKFPLMGHRKDLPSDITTGSTAGGGNKKGKEKNSKQSDSTPTTSTASVSEKDLETAILAGGFVVAPHWYPDLNWLREYNGQKPFVRNIKEDGPEAQAGQRFEKAMHACAFSYDFSGDKQSLEECKKGLLRSGELWQQTEKEYKARSFRLIAEGIFTDNTLHLGFQIGGTTRPPYNQASHGIINDFDLIASGLDPESRDKIIQNFILPAGIRCREHYFGPGNQQATADYVIMYAGMAARNWPLVSFAYSSEHGMLNNIESIFGDDGVATEAVTRNLGYQEYSITPILWTLELLYHRGINEYGIKKVRAFTAPDKYKYTNYVNFLQSNRLK